MAEDFDESALEYHRSQSPRESRGSTYQAPGQPARPGTGLFTPRCSCLQGSRPRSHRGSHRAFTLSKVLSDSVGIGLILLGVKQPVHILTPAAIARRIVNMTSLAVVGAQDIDCELTGVCVPIS